MGSLHVNAAPGEVHAIHNGEFTTYALLTAAPFADPDIGKVYRVTDDGGLDEYYILKASTPVFYKVGTKEVSSLSTTDATETAIYTLETVSDYIYQIETTVIATVNTGGNAAGYKRIATFKNDSGTLAIIATTTDGHTAENNSAWDCQIEANGTEIRVNVTGAAGIDINWEAYSEVFAKPNGA